MKRTYENATAKAVAYLERKMRTEGQVREKLHELGYSDDEITEAVQELKESLLLDDEEYAKLYVEGRQNTRPTSRRALTHKLKERKVPDAIIEEAVCAIDDEKEMENAYNEAVAYMRINIRKESDKRKLFGRITRRLLSHGYTYSTANEAVSAAFEDVSEEMADF